MPRPLSEQSVVIVGASSGIGRATALELARAGARVTVAARSSDALDSLVAEIESAGGQAQAVTADAADPAAVHALAECAEQVYGRIDTWVNAAAVGIWAKVEDVTAEEFSRVLQINVIGHLNGVHAALPALRRSGGGVVIGISSVEGVRAVPLHGPYTASKFALRAMYDCLRMELAAEGEPIAVTTILPATIDTPFFEHARSKVDGAMPKGPPPVYAPEVVARAIGRAAVRPTREVPVGAPAVGFYLGQRLSPALTDAVLSIPWLQRAALTDRRPDNGTDNLNGPIAGTGRTRGQSRGPVLQHSAFTALLGQLPRPAELVGSLLTRARRRPVHQAEERST